MKEKVTICIVDDDEIFQFITKKTFERLNRTDDLYIFSNGEEAIQFFQSHTELHPDVIFVDINMPIMDGWDFMDALETMNMKYPQVFIVSSSIDDKDLSKAKAMPLVKDYITKPLDEQTIRYILNSVN
ncbi:MAG: response regulator [Cytophagaceae bacterium]|jgi:CheY-like chemotaxis protein|nr:response regulator [Cytophagaceae bacterium]